MSQLESLIRELTAAKRRIRDAQEALDATRVLLAERRKALQDAIRAKEELEDEITDPAKRPMAAIWSRSESDSDSADEDQRGPTDPPRPPTRPKRRGPAAAAEESAGGDAAAVEWTSADLERELESAITAPMGVRTDAWDTFRDLGCVTNIQIAEILRSIWPRGGYAYHAGQSRGRNGQRSPGYTIHGFPQPQFWVGPRRHTTMHRPTLESSALVDRVRRILDLPAPQIHAQAEQVPSRPARKPATKQSPQPETAP